MKSVTQGADCNGVLDRAVRRVSGERHIIRQVEAILLRAKIATPVKTSFGTMPDRPALLVRLTDDSGCAGHGEIWCNFPRRGAEYKAGLLVNEFAFWLKDREFGSPVEIFDGLTRAFAVLALQTADPGTPMQIIAGIDQALWDLVARKRSARLCELFGGTGDSVPAYASGIHPEDAQERVADAMRAGFAAFKIKVGFGMEIDHAGLDAARGLIGDRHNLMIDANQAWASAEQAAENIRALQEFDLCWVEEPMRASATQPEWQRLKTMVDIPVAGGENLASLDDIASYRDSRIFAFLQPDIGKIGGFTGLLRVLERRGAAHANPDCVYCPHWLGGMVGLAASAHLLTAIGGNGLLEVDVNENPIRDRLADWRTTPSGDGRISLPEGDGIGVVPDLRAMESLGIDIEIATG